MSVPATISFARGAPSLDIIDVEGLRACADRAFSTDAANIFGYGTAIGYPPLRQWIADFHGVAPEHVLVTNGSMQAAAFLFDQFATPGDAVIVESPTYDRTLAGLRGRGAEVHAVALEHDGIDVDALEVLLRGGLRPRLAHIIANFHNPAGCTLSLAKRGRLLALAREFGFVIFEDDPYAALRFTGEDLPTMLDISGGDGTVYYASSFSKTICPGIRAGYLVGPLEGIERIRQAATSTYISPNLVAQSIVNEFCRSGRLERSIETVRTALDERCTVLTGALRHHIPEARFEVPEGGYFLWVTLPEECDVDVLLAAAAERGVAIVKGRDFLLAGGRNTMRLAFSAVTADRIDEGVARLADALHSAGVAA